MANPQCLRAVDRFRRVLGPGHRAIEVDALVGEGSLPNIMLAATPGRQTPKRCAGSHHRSGRPAWRLEVEPHSMEVTRSSASRASTYSSISRVISAFTVVVAFKSETICPTE